MKRFLCLFLGVWLTIYPMQIRAHETRDSSLITIEDEQTPTALSRDNHIIMVASVGMMGLIFIGLYLNNKSLRQPKYALAVTDVKDNGDGSYRVSVGLNQPNKEVLPINRVALNVTQGCAIVVKRVEQQELKPGNNKDVFVTIVNEDTHIQFRIDNQQIDVRGKEIKEGLMDYE